MKKRFKVIIVMALVFVSLYTGIQTIIDQKEKDQRVVVLDRGEQKKIVFYKDDCPDCQKIFNQLFWHDVRHKDMIFVNLNQEENRKYIKIYDVKSVPTIVHESQKYEGIDRKKIRTILNESR
ncbi:thioredoxin [Enterococcus hulanensis]|uniref:thioredoxin family protein n=1 Tax=Enterococcus hulanensis TaxID=2559929 RepID=UPI001A8EA60D|nr:thioredoxin family protein [Enterococcus hulanensis]MBO0455797.1 thioredoxin [Enterococcus hulanensis]